MIRSTFTRLIGTVKVAFRLRDRETTSTRKATPRPVSYDYPEEQPPMFNTRTFFELIHMAKMAIKGRADSSRMMREEANKTSGMEKHKIHLRMRRYGYRTRHYLLAYALIRGREYKQVEQNCRPENKPSAWEIQVQLAGFFDCIEIDACDLWSEKDIEAWLEGKAPVSIWGTPKEVEAAA